MTKKSIIVLITGQLRYFSKSNYENLIENFKDYNLEFFITCWEDQEEKLLDLFSSIYKPIELKKIKIRNFSSLAKNILTPDTAVNPENIFHMWHSFVEGCKEIKKYVFQNKPDYILRYRSDILPKVDQLFINHELKTKQVLIPDRYHWNGINDQFFLFNYSNIDDFINIDEFIINYQKKNLLFSSELIFQRFLKQKNIKIKFVDYHYNIMRKENKNNKKFENKKIIKLKLYDKIAIKLNKLKFKLRNFNNFYLKKNKRNNQQDIIIK
tara:strand:- start:17 stop:817 length:801 start_codon:yes stop_codon:yes gene_type:complete